MSMASTSFNMDMGYAVGDLGLITKTEDRGLTWINSSPPDELQLPTLGMSCFLMRIETGIIIGEDGYIGSK
jgi:hypothetical protein